MRTLFVIACFCLLLSLIVHVLSFTNGKFLDSIDGIVLLLHGGVFLVWVPTFFIAGKGYVPSGKGKFISYLLRFCPLWMRMIIALFIVYGFTNILVSLILIKKSDPPWWPFSSFWILLYSLGAGAIYSYLVSKKNDHSNTNEISENKIN
jgi:hypothetical protein